LGIANARDALAKSLDDDEKGVENIYTPGGPQQMSVINESGLYTLILRSNKPAARPFRKWVTAEVLPAIRKTGSYQQPGADPDKPETLLIVAREFRAAVRMARAAGLRDAEAVLAADRLTSELTGFSPVALLDEDVAGLLEEAL
jgi:prophage antirepressor-like protein